MCVWLLSFLFISSWFDRTAGSLCEIADICISDVSEDYCGPGEILVPNSHIFNCCPSCQPDTSTTTVSPDPGECRAPANCLPDGRFAPVQCKGDAFTGRCFCSDENGNRIFGQMWRNKASEMTCACSRRRWELEKQDRLVTLHCTANGDYEPLQCDDGMCWCANTRTGQPTVPPVPDEDMKLLPCYSERVMGAQYLRRCESLVYALAAISKEQSEHGTNFLGNPITFCDYDGSYGPYQIQGSNAYCTGQDGKILGVWQESSQEIGNLNCNCARDSMIYFPENGMDMSSVCQSNGNYRPNQNSGGVNYCVDTDGYPIECDI